MFVWNFIECMLSCCKKSIWMYIVYIIVKDEKGDWDTWGCWISARGKRKQLKHRVLHSHKDLGKCQQDPDHHPDQADQ